MASREFEEIQARCHRNGVLWEDPDFKADNSNLYTSGSLWGVTWERPKDIAHNAIFFHGLPDYHDFDQGELGNCWFVASVACLASSPHKKLLARVVPQDQSFVFPDKYCGLFRFNFWQYGKWTEVMVDDRLPVRGGKLLYGQNRTHPNEFWCPLLEKAYAKLHGGYDVINGGRMHNALVDMTGGLGELVDLKEKIEMNELRTLLLNTKNMNSYIGAAILMLSRYSVSREILLKNGLHAGHAYSVIDVKEVSTRTGKTVILHVRNPWGKGEWRGDWSDGSPQWDSLSAKDRAATKRTKVDGEFWISMEDFKENFDELEFCHLTPDAFSTEIADNQKVTQWRVTEHHGAWVKGVSAGGHFQPINHQFWTNPQYELSLKDRDTPTSVVVSLMRKVKDQERHVGIGFDVFKLGAGRKPQKITEENFHDLARLELTSGTFWPYRERTVRFEMEPVNYVIVPCTYRPDAESEFYMRVFCDSNIKSETPLRPVTGEGDDVAPVPSVMRVEEKRALEEFDRQAAATGSVWPESLVQVFTAAFKDSATGLKGFNLETCRCLASLVNQDSQTGAVNRAEFENLLKTIVSWRKIFGQIDKDKTGSVDSSELKILFREYDFGDSDEAIAGVMRRYGGADGRVREEDFVQGYCRTLQLYKTYQDLNPVAKAFLSHGQWITLGFMS